MPEVPPRSDEADDPFAVDVDVEPSHPVDLEKRRVLLTAIGLQYLALALGVGWWKAIWTYRNLPLTEWMVAGMAAMALLLWGWLRKQTDRGHGSDDARRARSLSGLLVFYGFFIMLTDPFLLYHKEPIDIVGIVLVFPPLLCLKSLVRGRNWPAAAGSVLLTAAMIACFLFNASARNFGIGFSSRWVY